MPGRAFFGETVWGRRSGGAARKRCRRSFLTLPPQSKIAELMERVGNPRSFGEG